MQRAMLLALNAQNISLQTHSLKKTYVSCAVGRITISFTETPGSC